tara:strand:+ start:523 stop:726 length:204 start_codon:yes stop_codon:yes gene_type:complete
LAAFSTTCPYLRVNHKKLLVMGGPIEDNKRERTKEQKNPTNPTGNRNEKTNKVDIDEKTIKDQQNKK